MKGTRGDTPYQVKNIPERRIEKGIFLRYLLNYLFFFLFFYRKEGWRKKGCPLMVLQKKKIYNHRYLADIRQKSRNKWFDNLLCEMKKVKQKIYVIGCGFCKGLCGQSWYLSLIYMLCKKRVGKKFIHRSIMYNFKTLSLYFSGLLHNAMVFQWAPIKNSNSILLHDKYTQFTALICFIAKIKLMK